MKKEDIINEITGIIAQDCHCVVNNKESFDSYYFFEVEKSWLFGIWITENPESQTYTIQLFGQYKKFIDKFKPSYSPINYSFDIFMDADSVLSKYCIYPAPLFNFVDDVWCVINSSIGSLIKFYWTRDEDKNPFWWLFKNFLYYNIQKPTYKFKANQLLSLRLKLRSWIAGSLFSKWIADSYVEDREVYCWPRFILHLHYKNNISNNALFRVYHLLNKLEEPENCRVENSSENSCREVITYDYDKSLYKELYLRNEERKEHRTIVSNLVYLIHRIKLSVEFHNII